MSPADRGYRADPLRFVGFGCALAGNPVCAFSRWPSGRLSVRRQYWLSTNRPLVVVVSGDWTPGRIHQTQSSLIQRIDLENPVSLSE